jgi:hypothetical protein
MNTWNKEFCTKWVEALRSGNFKQGKRCLHMSDDDGDKYCCLGVACEVRGFKAALEENWGSYSIFKYAKETAVLPRAMASAVFMEDKNSNGELSFEARKGGLICLSQINDDGFTFDQIADIISYEAGL